MRDIVMNAGTGRTPRIIERRKADGLAKKSRVVKCTDAKIKSIMKALENELIDTSWEYLKDWIEEHDDDRRTDKDR